MCCCWPVCLCVCVSKFAYHYHWRLFNWLLFEFHFGSRENNFDWAKNIHCNQFNSIPSLILLDLFVCLPLFSSFGRKSLRGEGGSCKEVGWDYFVLIITSDSHLASWKLCVCVSVFVCLLVHIPILVQLPSLVENIPHHASTWQMVWPAG